MDKVDIQKVAEMLGDYIGIRKEFLYDQGTGMDYSNYYNYPFGQFRIKKSGSYQLKIRIDWSNLVTEGKTEEGFKQIVIDKLKGQ
ncbi:MAG: hypothetical protein JW754_01515 [Candidatus Aenigmarchaeota archaeon]|nr:hypothetical protein [Candidatus Aenigmarchaeota archaeon]